MQFIKNSLREFKHVVWPTREETKKYFVIVLIVLISFGLYLFIVGNIFSEALFGIKKMVNPNSTINSSNVIVPDNVTTSSEIEENIETEVITEDIVSDDTTIVTE